MDLRWLLLFATACGTAPPVSYGDPHAAPALEALPDFPARPLTSHMRESLAESRRLLAWRPPRLPEDFSHASLEAWTERELDPWLAEKTRAVERAELDLDRAATETYPQRVIAAALIGLLYEDLARVIENLPPPDELLDEPALLLVYRDVCEAKALPLRLNARRGYRRCAFVAQAGDEYAGFMRFCTERDEILEPRYDGMGTELRVDTDVR